MPVSADSPDAGPTRFARRVMPGATQRFVALGLGALVSTRGRLERSNRRMALVLSNRIVLKIFQITHFDELFEIYPSLRAAVDREGNGNGNGLEAGTHEDPGRPT
jgi:hypothetical protein